MLKKAFIRNKIYWFSLTVTILLAYGSTLSNFSIGVDDESFGRYFIGGELLAQGRWGGQVTRFIFNSYEFLPFWRDFIGLILIATGVTLWGYLIQKFSNNYFNDASIIVFSCVAICCPFLVDNFIFMMTTVEMGMVLCLTAFSINGFMDYVVNDREGSNFRKIFFSICSLIYGLAFSELAVVYFLIGMFIVTFISTTFNSKNAFNTNLKILLVLLKGLVFISIALILNSGIKFALQKIFLVIPSDYTSRQIVYNFDSFDKFVTSVLDFVKSLSTLYLKTDHIGPSITLSLSILLILYGLCVSIKRKKVIFMLLCIGCVIAAFSMYLISGNAFLAKRVFITNSVFNGFIVSLLFTFFQNKQSTYFLKKASILLVVLLVLYQTKYINQVFFTDYMRYQLDVTKMHTIAEEILKVEKGKQKGVVFIGKPEDYNLKMGDVEGYSIFQWDRFTGPKSELKSGRIFRFMNMHGYNFNPAENVKENDVIIKSSIMPSYPKSGFVKDEGDYIIVKIGEAPFQTSSLTHEKFIEEYKNNPSKIVQNADFFSYKDNLLSIVGWGVKKGTDSTNTSIQVALVNNQKQYFLKTYSVVRKDVTNAFQDGHNYNNSGYSVASFSTSEFASGDYDLILILDSDEKEFVSLDKKIHIP
ncbi:glucosyltransferase domain-containing protein [Paenibacillus polymyxa]|uniref:glucosyltransferase domain-containing protein n=1 Tax=Paenibacillus polymyxa TaxID=1406 RepID=UPI0003D38ACF|nr:glucosyltransferase domain-containing protein [Paenibacillus polymyxa]AIW41887.1 hypothetical protein X809_39170 [Paenibacillus polymyxa CR1]